MTVGCDCRSCTIIQQKEVNVKPIVVKPIEKNETVVYRVFNSKFSPTTKAKLIGLLRYKENIWLTK